LVSSAEKVFYVLINVSGVNLWMGDQTIAIPLPTVKQQLLVGTAQFKPYFKISINYLPHECVAQLLA
jgi:hypothetical protein